MAVRYWAKVQNVAGNIQNAVSSYALTWMVLFFLMYRQPQVIPKVWDVLTHVEGESMPSLSILFFILIIDSQRN